MSPHIVDVDVDSFRLIPAECQTALFWELPSAASVEDARFQKEEWFSSTLLEWGGCGKLLIEGEAVLGFAQYAPVTLFGRVEEFPAGNVSDDAVYLGYCYLDANARGRGLGRRLVGAVARDIVERGYRAASRSVIASGTAAGSCPRRSWGRRDLLGRTIRAIRSCGSTRARSTARSRPSNARKPRSGGEDGGNRSRVAGRGAFADRVSRGDQPAATGVNPWLCPSPPPRWPRSAEESLQTFGDRARRARVEFRVLEHLRLPRIGDEARLHLNGGHPRLAQQGDRERMCPQIDEAEIGGEALLDQLSEPPAGGRMRRLLPK